MAFWNLWNESYLCPGWSNPCFDLQDITISFEYLYIHAERFALVPKVPTYLPVRFIFPKFNPIVDGKGPNFDAWQRRASTLSFCLTKRSRVLFSNFVTLNLF